MFYVWKTTLHTVEAAGSIPATPTKKLSDNGQLNEAAGAAVSDLGRSPVSWKHDLRLTL
jgi:hypothetical protein